MSINNQISHSTNELIKKYDSTLNYFNSWTEEVRKIEKYKEQLAFHSLNSTNRLIESQNARELLLKSFNSSIVESLKYNDSFFNRFNFFTLGKMEKIEALKIKESLVSNEQLVESFNFPVLEQFNLSAMERYFEPQRRFQELVFPANSSILEQVNNALKLQCFFKEQIKNFDFNDVHINDDGELCLKDEIVSAENINKNFDNISVEYESNDNFICKITEWIKNQKNINIIVIFMLIMNSPVFQNLNTLVNTLITIISTFESSVSTDDNEQQSRIVKKEIIKKANEIPFFEELQGYRFVSTKFLSVRKFGNNKSDKIDELHLGTTVRLIEKEKDWCFIDYYDSDTGELREGWVFSRYLSKFGNYKGDKLSPVAQSFQQGFKEALNGETYPIETLWDDIEI